MCPQSLRASTSCTIRCFFSLEQALRERSINSRYLSSCKCGTPADLPELTIPQVQSSRPGQRAHSGVVSPTYLRSACNLGSNAHSWCEEPLFNKGMSDVIDPPGMAKGMWCSKRSSSAPPQCCCSEIHLRLQHPPPRLHNARTVSVLHIKRSIPFIECTHMPLDKFPLHDHAS